MGHFHPFSRAMLNRQRVKSFWKYNWLASSDLRGAASGASAISWSHDYGWFLYNGATAWSCLSHD